MQTPHGRIPQTFTEHANPSKSDQEASSCNTCSAAAAALRSRLAADVSAVASCAKSRGCHRTIMASVVRSSGRAESQKTVKIGPTTYRHAPFAA